MHKKLLTSGCPILTIRIVHRSKFPSRSTHPGVIHMYAINDYFADFNKSSVDQATKIANVTFEGFEQFINLNLSSAKTAFEVSTKNFKALAEITDVQDLVTFRTKATEAGVENALSYSRDAYEVFSGTQAEVSKLIEAGVATYQKNLVAVVDKAVKS